MSKTRSHVRTQTILELYFCLLHYQHGAITSEDSIKRRQTEYQKMVNRYVVRYNNVLQQKVNAVMSLKWGLFDEAHVRFWDETNHL